MSTREDSESTEFAEGVDSAPWEEVDMWLSLIVEYLGGGAMLISPSVSAKGKGEICQFLSCISYVQYVLDILWGQPIKLIQVVSTSEFHEY